MQVAREPPEHVGWKGGLLETLQQQVMGQGVKGLRKIYCLRHSAAGGGGGPLCAAKWHPLVP